MHRLIRLAYMQRLRVRVGIDGDGAHAEPPSRSDDPASDLAPVRDEERADHRAVKFTKFMMSRKI
jgi:hypothetical protein